jgi:hypothetical protein
VELDEDGARPQVDRVPIPAFSHCRDVVAAGARVGSVGVLGTTRQSIDQLAADLRWLDDKVGSLMHDVDLPFPTKTLVT